MVSLHPCDLTVAQERAAAGRCVEHWIRANTLSPGIIHSNLTAALLQDPRWWGKQSGMLKLKRVREPEDVVNAALFLASG
jgi:NAD(P)-dependent dehydrogenase (short-subunit alcohol dehydrogenase family)